eukprot:928219-Pelagomonas_calceolata.AAC.2
MADCTAGRSRPARRCPPLSTTLAHSPTTLACLLHKQEAVVHSTFLDLRAHVCWQTLLKEPQLPCSTEAIGLTNRE